MEFIAVLVWRVIMFLTAFMMVMGTASMNSTAHASAVGDQRSVSFPMSGDAALADKSGCCDQACGSLVHCASCVVAIPTVVTQSVPFDQVRINFPSEAVVRQSLQTAPEKAPPRLV